MAIVFGTNGTVLKYWNVLTPSGESVGRVSPGSVKRYYVKDHLGSTRSVVDSLGVVKERFHYDAWGMELALHRMVESGTSNERYTGHLWDGETGLLYAGARLLDPAIGRFLGVDPLADKFPAWSPYNYVMSNPLSLVDPDGKAAEDLRLRVSGDEASTEAAQKDIFDLAGEDASRVSFDESGNISVNTDGYSGGNPGLDIIVSMVNSDKMYEYAAPAGEVPVDSYGEPNGVDNLSVTYRGSGPQRVPPAGVDGLVSIHANLSFEQGSRASGYQAIPRAQVVGHELAENFARTDLGMPYLTEDRSGGAHVWANATFFGGTYGGPYVRQVK